MRLEPILAALCFVPHVYFQAPKLQTWEKVVCPGLTYHMEVDSEAPLLIHALKYSLGATGVKAIPELAGRTVNEEGSVKGRLTPTQMVSQESAIAGINGDFFNFTQGAPIGLTIREGELLDSPARSRAVFAWGPRSSAIGFCSTTASLIPDGESAIKLGAVNQPCGANDVVLYSPTEGLVTCPSPSVTLVVALSNPTWAPSTVLSGTVEYALPDAQTTKVPEGKAFIVATGEKIQSIANLKPGQKLTIKLQSRGFDWEKMENVISGGPILLKGGKVDIDAEAEGFGAAFATKRHPRTAIGRTSDGDIWLAVVDGRQEISVGATLEEMAKVMLRLGCVDAINLDGGGSTCMHLMGVTVNRPSDGVERPVSNAVLVFGPKMVAYKGELKMVVSPKIALASQVEIHLTLDGVPVPNSDVIWGAQGAGWIDQGGILHPLETGKVKLRAIAYGQALNSEIQIVEKVGKPGKVGRSKG